MRASCDAEQKADAATALVMAIGRPSITREERSVHEGRGILFV